jgi:hypothetical protein
MVADFVNARFIVRWTGWLKPVLLSRDEEAVEL